MNVRSSKSVTFEQAQNAAGQCSTFTEFEKEHPAAYHSACQNGWLEEVRAQLSDDRHDWTLERLKEEAAKYQTLSKFAAGSTGAYITARDGGFLDEVKAALGTDGA